MSPPLWVPWFLALALAWPLLRIVQKPDRSTALVWVPAVAMLLLAAWLTVDHSQVSQDELDEAARDAASRLSASLGPVTQDRVALLMEREIGSPLSVEASEVERGADEVTYTMEVRPRGEESPVACLSVEMEGLSADPTPLWLTDVTAEGDGCG